MSWYRKLFFWSKRLALELFMNTLQNIVYEMTRGFLLSRLETVLGELELIAAEALVLMEAIFDSEAIELAALISSSASATVMSLPWYFFL